MVHQHPNSASTRPLEIIAGADDFGCSLKDALVAQLRALNIEVEDIGTSKYYSVGEEIGRRVSQASGSKPWPDEIQTFLDGSVEQMSKIGGENVPAVEPPCFICSVARSRQDKDFGPVDIMPGGSMVILRETPTSAIVRFKAGSVEPAHHHTFGHDLVVMKGSKCVWNLTKKEKYDLGIGDYLFTPAGDVHSVKYFVLHQVGWPLGYLFG